MGAGIVVIQERRIQILRRSAIVFASFVMLLTLGATAQENRSDISLQGTGFFTRDTSGNGISRAASDTGGFLVGYGCHINRWFSAEGNYGFDEILKNILVVSENPESRPTCTRSPAIWW